MAWVVMEFLEKSPVSKLKSARLKASFSSSLWRKEPESVDGKKRKLSSGGSLFLRVSGKNTCTERIGFWLARASAVRISKLKFWLLPPKTLISPCFWSGIFQLRSE